MGKNFRWVGEGEPRGEVVMYNGRCVMADQSGNR